MVEADTQTVLTCRAMTRAAVSDMQRPFGRAA